MKLCILEEDYGLSQEPYGEYNPPSSPESYFSRHEWERYFLNRTNGVRQVTELARKGFDVFVNLCDGAWGGESPGIEIVQALERLDVPFTGADTPFYEPNRQQMKLVCQYSGIATPRCVFASSEEDLERAAALLRFPLIVKHPNSYSSIGLTPASRVMTAEALSEQAHLMIGTYGSTLIEEFIEGREFTVLVAENPDDPRQPIVYQPVEFQFPPTESFKHFHLKWVDFATMGCRPCEDPDLIESLMRLSRQMFLGLGGVSYGRCDIRMNEKGELYLLEINPNCGVFYPPQDAGSADFILMNDPAGHAGFVDTILQAALARHRRRRRKWDVRLRGGSHYGLFSTHDLTEGETVLSFERQGFRLVTRSELVREPAWFDRFGFPLTDEVWIRWSDHPDEWRPVNHSCDPNVWWEGLNLVARRPIPSGEEITVDYATFCHESMEAFTCSCEAPDCRKRIEGSDSVKPFLARYGSHVSEYVRNRRQHKS